MTELKYGELLERLLGQIGSEFGVNISRYSFGHCQSKKYRTGDLTYDVNSAFDVKLCRWVDSVRSNCESVPRPSLTMKSEEESEFEDALRLAVKKLLEQEA
jgi:hypothetical protein